MEIAFEGKPYWFLTFTGKVASVSAWTTTSVTSSGGGGSGYIHPQHGGHINVSAPTIKSQTHNHQKFWLVSAEGEEKEISKADFSCREGQQATVIWGAAKGEESGKYLAIRNDATGSIVFFDDSSIEQTFHGYGQPFIKLSLIYFSIIFIESLLGFALSNGGRSDSVVGTCCALLVPVLFLVGFCHLMVSKGQRTEECKKFVLSLLESGKY
ncbi:hypothetical protein [Acetobacter cibinongensis]|uniref:Uncharacterized protein n=1 Tax=Acetobacter cibinongensis TaxID=146475 RepID=A0A1Z5YYZ0_9PROT|nr:hypothetical protein [Acetobacter cibinongensis]OUJ04588.1 hypothetical protein HK14_00025 [Acetobacter cibinongensis]